MVSPEQAERYRSTETEMGASFQSRKVALHLEMLKDSRYCEESSTALTSRFGTTDLVDKTCSTKKLAAVHDLMAREIS